MRPDKIKELFEEHCNELNTMEITDFSNAINQFELKWCIELSKRLTMIAKGDPVRNMDFLRMFNNHVKKNIEELEK